MIVCICHRVSDRDITREARLGCSSFQQLQDETRVATACGACRDCAQTTFDAAVCASPHCTAPRAGIYLSLASA